MKKRKKKLKEKVREMYLILLRGHRASSELYCRFLRKKGVLIGEGTVIYSPQTTEIDETRPYLISIGKNVHITRGVTILSHGFDWSVIKGKYGDILGSSGKVSIGDNVFIGVNSTILKGVSIGNNVIIGANSLVCKDVPDNCVAGGVPARVISSLEEYYKKRKEIQVKEASELVQCYVERYGTLPQEDNLHEFFWLFQNRNESLCKLYSSMMELGNNPEITYEIYKEQSPLFEGMDEFLKYCLRKKATQFKE